MVAQNLEMLASQVADLIVNAKKVVVFTGAGRGFCSGADVAMLGATPSEASIVARIELAKASMDRVLAVRNMSKPTIAAVNGYCLGAAITFLICHDLAMASEEKARFGLPEVFRGFPPKSILTSLFRVVPTKWAFDMVLTGDNWDARTAQKAGLISRIVPHAKLQELSLEWAKEIARCDRLALEYSKKAAHAGMDEPIWSKSMALTSYICEEHTRLNPKTHDGMRDFLAKKGEKASHTIKWV